MALGLSMAIKGVCRTKAGWGTEDSVWAEYADPTRLYELPASQYVALGYQPPVEKLPYISEVEFQLPNSGVTLVPVYRFI